MSTWTDINKWIRKYGWAALDKTGDVLLAANDVWNRLEDAVIDTATLVSGEILKAPSGLANLANEAGKFGYEVATGNKAKENFIDTGHEEIKNYLDNKTKSLMQTDLSDEDLDTARSIASFATPSIVKGASTSTKVNTVAKNAPKVIDKIKKTKTYAQTLKETFIALMKKDKKLKVKKDALKKITKEYSKAKPSMNPEQVARMESHILKETTEINKLLAKSKTAAGKVMKSKIKTTKDMDKIINPTPIKDAAKKVWLATAWTVGLWVGYSALDSDDDESGAADFDRIVNGEDIPLAPGIDPEVTTEEEATDTTSETTSADNTTTTQSPDAGFKYDSEPKASTSMEDTWGRLTDQSGKRIPVYRDGDTLKVKDSAWAYHTIATGVTDSNINEKFALAANKTLPF